MRTGDRGDEETETEIKREETERRKVETEQLKGGERRTDKEAERSK